jgi:putative peptide zinc metalloprotease protein
MQVLSIDYNNHRIVLDLSPWNGTEIMLVDDKVVSQKHNRELHSLHEVQVEAIGVIQLSFRLNLKRKEIAYQCKIDNQIIEENVKSLLMISTSPNESNTVPNNYQQTVDIETSASEPLPKANSKWMLLPLIFKLVKSIQVIKVALLATSVGAYSILFSVEFALALVGVLVFHEYGHLRAMKKFGIPTKGMYLIPFVGGMAVGDSPRTRWEDVYISMMGPVYGLFMTVIFYIIYLITNSHFAGLVTSMSALLNLFNLIPVHPLDGGRVVKALVFSGRSKLAFIGLLFLSSVCMLLAWQSGFVFLMFFIVLGVIDIITSWRISLAEDITPLKPYGIFYSIAWYLITVAIFIGLIILIASDHLPGSEIAMKVLRS